MRADFGYPRGELGVKVVGALAQHPVADEIERYPLTPKARASPVVSASAPSIDGF